MDKNLAVPALMVVAFVAIVASLFAGPLTEDQLPVVHAYVGETLCFEYTLPEGSEPLQLSLDGDVEIHQQAGLAHGVRHSSRAMFTIDNEGIHIVKLTTPPGVSTTILIIDAMNPSPENPPADGPRDITRLVVRIIGAFVSTSNVDLENETPIETDPESPDHNASWDYKLTFKSSDPAKGSVADKEQTVPRTDAQSRIVAHALVIDNVGVVITMKTTAAILPVPTWFGFNLATPAEGYEMDYWTMNGEQGKFFKIIHRDNAFEAHFKEKTS